MFKMIVFLKRKPGMSDQAFRDYYEKNHAMLVQRSAPKMRKYVRNYITPIGNEMYAPDDSGGVDCVTEAWFETTEDYESTISHILGSTIAEDLARDEENLFDRPFIRWFKAEEFESELDKADHD